LRDWRRVGFWSGLLLSSVAIWWLARTQDWSAAVDAASRADWRWLILAGGLLAADWMSRGLRWRTLFPAAMAPRFWSALAATMAGYLFNNILPARAGDVLRAHLLGRREALARSRVFGTIVVERATDLVVLLALLSFAVLTREVPAWAAYAARFLAALSIAVVLALAFLVLFGRRLVEQANTRLTFLPQRIRERLQVSGTAFVEGLAGIRRFGQLCAFIGLTAAIWSLEVGVAQVFSHSLGMPLSAADALFVLLLIALGTMVPAAPGYIGTFEFFGLAALSLVGVRGSAAVAFVVLLHLTIFIGSSIAGAICLAATGWPSRTALAGKESA
jgi:uncharacterized protein (TIRG00374 family)